MVKKKTTPPAPAATAAAGASAPALPGQAVSEGATTATESQQGGSAGAGELHDDQQPRNADDATGTQEGDKPSEGGDIQSLPEGDQGLAENMTAGDGEPEASDAADPELPEFPITDVLRNNSGGEFLCRATGLCLPPGASRAVTIRDAEHLEVFAQAIAAFDRTQPRAGLLKFDVVAL